ncbi:hypothetical protein BJX99DRAFT_241796 [Aspergillus californicus]
MTRCLASATLLCLHRMSCCRPHVRRGFRSSSPAVSRSGWGLPWTRQFSAHVHSQVFDSQFIEELGPPSYRQCPISPVYEKRPERYISKLDDYLLTGERSTTKPDSSEISQNPFLETIELTNLLFHARDKLNLDLLAHRGIVLNDWSAVYALLNRLLDVAEKFREFSPPLRGKIEEWASASRLSLDQLTGQALADQEAFSPPSRPQTLEGRRVSQSYTLDDITNRPSARFHYMYVMAEFWKCLGSIVLDAADAPSIESNLAMSCVHRVLARLHHSGVISERVYQYTIPGSYQIAFRPPGMHLLSTHIMDVLSDAAWMEHEAEVAAKAAANKQDSPYFPVRMGIKGLGHEIWLEFILWCCVEHGHIKEGAWLIDQMKTRTGDKVWKFQSWKPLLQDKELLRKTKVNQEVSWYQPDSVGNTHQPQKRGDPPLPFHGLGRRTISVEVVAALLDNIPNLVRQEMGLWVLHIDDACGIFRNLKFAIGYTENTKRSPTAKATNWFFTRLIQTNQLAPEVNTRTAQNLIRLIRYTVPHWNHSHLYPVDEASLEQLSPSQIYDDTSAFLGVLEYLLLYYSRRRLFDDVLHTFAMFQAVVDSTKQRRIEFFSQRMELSDAEMPLENTSNLPSLGSLEPIPQLSHATLAKILDLTTRWRAFTFGEWLLFSDDVDGPTIPPSAYGHQALAPSILQYAAATNNRSLGEEVIQSLTPPISLNTYRSVMNFRITMHQWSSAILMLEYIRENRSKTWGHGNISFIVAEIIRLDHTRQNQTPQEKMQQKKQQKKQRRELWQQKLQQVRQLRQQRAELIQQQMGLRKHLQRLRQLEEAQEPQELQVQFEQPQQQREDMKQKLKQSKQQEKIIVKELRRLCSSQLEGPQEFQESQEHRRPQGLHQLYGQGQQHELLGGQEQEPWESQELQEQGQQHELWGEREQHPWELQESQELQEPQGLHQFQEQEQEPEFWGGQEQEQELWEEQNPEKLHQDSWGLLGPQEQHQYSNTATIAEMAKSNLASAKSLLHRIMEREFHETPYREGQISHYQDRVLVSFIHLFRYIPSLYDFTSEVIADRYHISTFRTTLVGIPFIPQRAFNNIVAAVAETWGSRAAARILVHFCTPSRPPPSRTASAEEKARYFRQTHDKMVFSDAATIRIISDAAAQERQAASATLKALDESSKKTELETRTEGVAKRENEQRESLEAAIKSSTRVLVVCARNYEMLGFDDAEIANTLGDDILARYKTTKHREDRRRLSKTQKSRRPFNSSIAIEEGPGGRQ